MPRPIDSGILRGYLTWQQKTTLDPTPGTDGQPTVSFPAIGAYRAELVPVAGSQQVNATQLVPIRSYAIRIRYGPIIATIAAQDRLIYKGRTLTVTSAHIDEERNFWMIITADEQPGFASSGP